MTSTVVWGTGNIGRAAIRAVHAHPGLKLVAVLTHDPTKAGRDAGELAGLDEALGVLATSSVDSVLAARPGAVVYAASGEIRADEAVADIVQAIRAGAVVVSPSVYALYDQRNAPAEVRGPILAAIEEGGGSLFVSGVDPGWANDVLPVLLTGVGTIIDRVRCQEIFDYSTYDQEDSVRWLVGMGQTMDYEPPMLAPGVPGMVWGGQIRLIARGLGVELEDVREIVDRRALDATVSTKTMGEFEAGTQGAIRFEVQGIVDGEARIVIEHVTRIHPSCAPDWPTPPDGVGAHRVIIEGRPRIEVTVEATEPDGRVSSRLGPPPAAAEAGPIGLLSRAAGPEEGGNRSAGGNATAVGRLVNAIGWLVDAPPGLYDALDVPMCPGTLGRKRP